MPEAILYKIYMVYRDFTMLIIEVLSFTITPILSFSGALLVRYSNACLRLFCTRSTWFTEVLSQC